MVSGWGYPNQSIENCHSAVWNSPPTDHPSCLPSRKILSRVPSPSRAILITCLDSKYQLNRWILAKVFVQKENVCFVQMLGILNDIIWHTFKEIYASVATAGQCCPANDIDGSVIKVTSRAWCIINMPYYINITSCIIYIYQLYKLYHIYINMHHASLYIICLYACMSRAWEKEDIYYYCTPRQGPNKLRPGKHSIHVRTWKKTLKGTSN